VILIVYAITIAQGIIASQLPISISPDMVIIGTAGSFLATMGLFWFLYRFSPAQAPGATALLTGAATAAFLFELSKIVFGWYVRSTAGASAIYGTLSGLVFFFLWMYYACAVFVIGAEVAWAFENRART
jgi:membrane protein